MFGPGSCDEQTSVCAGGAFDDSESSSFNIVGEGNFSIQYFTEGSGVDGDYFTDDYTVGGKTIKDFEMGIARQAKSVSTGIMGIGFDLNEAGVSEGADPYPNYIDRLKADGLISAKSYSIYLDDLEADTGTVLFGGYDTAKFQGDLGILEIQPSEQTGTFSDFAVVLNSIGVTQDSGSVVLQTSDLPNAVILDTGTAFTILPHDIFDMLINFFGAVNDDTYGYIVECDLGGMTGSIDYQFGSSNGPLVSVPFDELAVPIVDLESGDTVTDRQGNPICRLGIDEQSQEGEPLLFGDTFLRSAYVVYDLDNLQIGVAQTVFNATDSNVQAITADKKGENLSGSIVSDATTIQQTATGDAGAGAETAEANSGTELATALGTGSGTAALKGVRTTYENKATNVPGASGSPGSPSSSTSRAMAGSIRASPAGKWVNMVAQVGGVLAAVSVGAMLLL